MHTTLPSFRRRPESRFLERKLDPGLRRDDGVLAMCACLSLKGEGQMQVARTLG
jgi:hypothetical protein